MNVFYLYLMIWYLTWFILWKTLFYILHQTISITSRESRWSIHVTFTGYNCDDNRRWKRVMKLPLMGRLVDNGGPLKPPRRGHTSVLVAKCTSLRDGETRNRGGVGGKNDSETRSYLLPTGGDTQTKGGRSRSFVRSGIILSRVLRTDAFSSSSFYGLPLDESNRNITRLDCEDEKITISSRMIPIFWMEMIENRKV